MEVLTSFIYYINYIFLIQELQHYQQKQKASTEKSQGYLWAINKPKFTTPIFLSATNIPEPFFKSPIYCCYGLWELFLSFDIIVIVRK